MRRVVTGKGFTVAAVLVALWLGAVQTAEAALSLRLTDGVTTVTVNDNDLGADANPLAGTITYVGPIGANWVVNVSTGIGTPIFTPGHMDLNSVNVSIAAGTGTFDIFFSENGFTSPAPGSNAKILFGGTLTSPQAGSNVTATLYGDDSNALFGTSNTIASVGPFAGAFSDTASGVIPAGFSTPYSLTQRISLNVRGPVTYSGDFEVLVPEPGLLSIFGLGLAGLAAHRRRQARG